MDGYGYNNFNTYGAINDASSQRPQQPLFPNNQPQPYQLYSNDQSNPNWTTKPAAKSSTTSPMKAILTLAAAIIASVLCYLLALVIKHRMRYRKDNDIFAQAPMVNNGEDLNQSTNAPTSSFWSADAAPQRERTPLANLNDLRVGDLIFTRQTGIMYQWDRLMSNPKDVALGAIAALPMQPSHPTHVAMVLSDLSTLRLHQPNKMTVFKWTDIELLNINSSSTDVCVTTLGKFVKSHPHSHFNVSVATLNKRFDSSVVTNIRKALNQTRPAYGTALIFTSMLPRSEQQFIPDTRTTPRATTLVTTPVLYDVTGLSAQWQYVSELYTLPSSRHAWRGIASKKQTCASLVYGAMESAGLVVSFVPQPFHEQAVAVKYGNVFAKDLMPEPTSDTATRRLIEPHALMPADFLRRDFQWTTGVHVNQHVDFWPLLLATPPLSS